MTFQRQVSHALDDEHRSHLEFLGRVEQAFARAPRSGASRDPELVRLADADLIIGVGGAIQGHPDGAAAGARVVREAIEGAVAARTATGMPA